MLAGLQSRLQAGSCLYVSLDDRISGWIFMSTAEEATILLRVLCDLQHPLCESTC